MRFLRYVSSASILTLLACACSTGVSPPKSGERLLPSPQGGQYGYISSVTGKWLINPAFNIAFPFFGPYARVQAGREWMLIQKDGSTAETPFGRAADWTGEYLVVPRGEKVRLLIDDGLSVAVFDEALGLFKDGLLLATNGGRYGYIDERGFWKIKPQFIAARPFHFGRAAVRTSDGWGFIDTDGEFAVEPTYVDVRSFTSDRVAAIRDEAGWAFIDFNNVVTPLPFPVIGALGSGVATFAAEDGGLYGIVSLDGEVVVKPKFYRLSGFAEGLSPAKSRLGSTDRQGYVNTRGEFVIAFSGSADMGPFRNGFAWVETELREGWIDRDGRWIWSRARKQGHH